MLGFDELVVMAGPCSIESEEQIERTAECVAAAGAQILRGGAFKPRTSPYSFQGLGEKGLQFMRKAADRHGLLVVTEVMDVEKIPLVADYADILQVGSRNMQNFSLLRALGGADRPIFLKRGQSATYDELIMAAEYILQGGNSQVILCERGVRSFEPTTRNMIDIAAVPVLKGRTDLPVVVDPSHGTGRRELVAPLSRAAIAAGADGLMIEVHPDPDKALSDGPQSLSCEDFASLMADLRQLHLATV